MKPYCRQLEDSRMIEHFVKNVLNIKNGNACSKAIDILTKAELDNIAIENKDTLTRNSFRDFNYVSEESRKILRLKIFNDLIRFERLEDDDKIRLGSGGSLPLGGVKADKQAFLIIGLPASGKSTFVRKVADDRNAIILDCDFAKRKFPEYRKFSSGASLVHEESDLIVFGKEGYNESNLLEYCCKSGYNIVIPKIGHDSNSILAFSKTLKEYWDYSIHLTLISLDRQKATIRAYYRFAKTKRYVPLSLIFDWYSNDPILTYYRIRNSDYFSSYGKLSSDVEINDPFLLIEATENNPATLYRI